MLTTSILPKSKASLDCSWIHWEILGIPTPCLQESVQPQLSAVSSCDTALFIWCSLYCWLGNWLCLLFWDEKPISRFNIFYFFYSLFLWNPPHSNSWKKNPLSVNFWNLVVSKCLHILLKVWLVLILHLFSSNDWIIVHCLLASSSIEVISTLIHTICNGIFFYKFLAFHPYF